MRVVERVLAELELADRPLIPVFNKMDLVPDPVGFAAAGAASSTPARSRSAPCAPAASRRSRRCCGRWSAPAARRSACGSPSSDGARLAALYRDGEVLSRQEDGAALDVVVRLDRWQVDRLRGEGVEVVDAAAGGEVGRRAG